MQKWKKVICRLRWGTIPQRMERGLVRLHDTLAATPLHDRYWINGGLLLGCIRDGGPISHDDDADFSFWESDRELMVEAVRALQSNGFRLRRKRPNNDGTFSKWSMRFQGIDFDFIQMENHGATIRWISHAGALDLEMLNEVPNHGLKKLELFGRQWMIPDEPGTYLEALYGNWREPNPNYQFWHDSKAIIERRPRIKHPRQ